MFGLGELASFIGRNYHVLYPTELPKQSNSIRIGLLGASSIAPAAVISAAKSHPEVTVVAVAARDPKRAAKFSRKHNIPIVHETYQALLDDPAIDAVYIPLPNGHHYEWTIKALRSGKHVLLEKPSVSNATEARKLFQSPLVSGPDSPVLLEALHYRFHPAWQTLMTLINPGDIVEAHACLIVPKGIIPTYDIRCKFALAGGCLMDIGTYPLSCIRQVFGTEPEECLEARHSAMPPGHDKEIDQAFSGKWRFPNGGVGSIEANMIADGGYSSSILDGFPTLQWPKLEIKHREVVIEDGLLVGEEHAVEKTVAMWNFPTPFIYHRIDIHEKHTIRATSDGRIVKSWTDTTYIKDYGMVGAESWTTYRYQLEEFVNRIRKRPTRTFVTGEDSIRQMEMIDGAYEKAGLPVRPSMTKV